MEESDFCPGTPGGKRRVAVGGAPWRDSENAFIFACMSVVNPLDRAGGGPGRRAALTWPRGVEEAVMLAVVGRSEVVFKVGGCSISGAEWERPIG